MPRVGLGRGVGRGRGGPFSQILSTVLNGLTGGLAVPGDHLSISADLTGIAATSWTSQAWGTSYGDTTYGTGSNPTDYMAGDGGTLFFEGVGNDTETYRASASIRYAAGTAPTIGAQSLTNGVDPGALDASASGANLTFTYSATGLPSGRSINTSTGSITGTPDTVDSGTAAIVATDQYGRTLEYGYSWTVAAGAVAVNPSLSLDSQTAGSGGSPDSLSVTYDYGGADTVDFYIVTTSSATPESQANIIAGAGGNTIEGDSVLGYTGTQNDLSGFTTDTGVTHIQAVAVERNNGGTSGVQVLAVSDIDFAALGFTSAEAIDANTVEVTLDDTIFGTGAAVDWSFDIGGVAATITGAAIAGSVVTLTVSDTMTSGDTLDNLSYAGGDLTDERANALADFGGDGTNEAITNSIPAGAATASKTNVLSLRATSGATITISGASLYASGTGQENVVFLAWKGAASLTSATIDGQTATIIGQQNVGGGTSRNVAAIRAPSTANATGDIVLNFSSSVATQVGYEVWGVVDATTYVFTGDTSTQSIDVSVNVSADDLIFGMFEVNNGSSGISWTGLTKESEIDIDSGEWTSTANVLSGVTAATPRTITATQGTTTAGTVGFSLVVR